MTRTCILRSGRFPSASSAVFQAFICDRLEDNTPMLRVDYSVTCWEVNGRLTASSVSSTCSSARTSLNSMAVLSTRQGKHLGIVAYTSIMALVYPIGTPLLYAALLYANSEQLERIKHDETTARLDKKKKKLDGDSKAEMRAAVDAAAKQSLKARKTLQLGVQKLVAGYEMRCYW